ncbi:MAG TPA: response regulator transcription factor [Vicinamibacterales bacterium]|nr:response regulator transcription factor [Vicinamibacterales bacterium]
MFRVLLVDDHPVVRIGIRRILIDGIKDVSIDEADNAAQTVMGLRRRDWDIVVLDLSLPGASGIDVVKWIHLERPRLPVLVLSMHPASQFERRVLAAGANGYLTKDSAPAELVQAIDAIRRGRRYAVRSGDTAAAPHDALSDREYQVLRLIGSGQMVSEIAERLALSVKTVSTYRVRLLDKMHMRSNVELMRYALDHGLLES